MRRKHAVALRYAAVDELPTVLAHGHGALAVQLLRIAEQHNIPIRSDHNLLQLLEHTQPGVSISAEAQKIIAHVISYLYYCDEKFKRRHSFLAPVLG